MRQSKPEALQCSFCHKSKDVVAKLISSPSDYPRVYICDECVRAATPSSRMKGYPPRRPRSPSAPATA